MQVPASGPAQNCFSLDARPSLHLNTCGILKLSIPLPISPGVPNPLGVLIAHLICEKRDSWGWPDQEFGGMGRVDVRPIVGTLTSDGRNPFSNLHCACFGASIWMQLTHIPGEHLNSISPVETAPLYINRYSLDQRLTVKLSTQLHKRIHRYECWTEIGI